MAMSEEDYEQTREEAKAEGKDYVVYDYKSFKALFAQCVHCEWVEYLPGPDWRDDDATCASLMKHTINEHRKGGGFLDQHE